ncbi:DUF6642 family protein [Arenimonas composti]|uniref:DUF6642 family protein n=1 Tax=Arenimonas composti TaxID=370776 RepID=UPI0012B673C8|nr:DUF6642 family protein [Arenimonas composti]
MAKKGVFCIEGEWSKSFSHQDSVRPLVEFLTAGDDLRPAIYRRAASADAFIWYLGRWLETTHYDIGFLTFHGTKGKIELGRDVVSLNELADLLSGKCEGRHILLSCCQTLKVTKEELAELRVVSKARSVSGYTKSPDFVEGSAFDLMVLTRLLYHDRPARAEEWLQKNCAGLVQNYGFVMDYRTRR